MQLKACLAMPGTYAIRAVGQHCYQAVALPRPRAPRSTLVVAAVAGHLSPAPARALLGTDDFCYWKTQEKMKNIRNEEHLIFTCCDEMKKYGEKYWCSARFCPWDAYSVLIEGQSSGGVRAGVVGDEKRLYSAHNYLGSLSTLVPASKPCPAQKEHPGPCGISA